MTVTYVKGFGLIPNENPLQRNMPTFLHNIKNNFPIFYKKYSCYVILKKTFYSDESEKLCILYTIRSSVGQMPICRWQSVDGNPQMAIFRLQSLAVHWSFGCLLYDRCTRNLRIYYLCFCSPFNSRADYSITVKFSCFWEIKISTLDDIFILFKFRYFTTHSR